MRRALFLAAAAVLAGGSATSAGPIGLAVTDDAGGGAGLFSGIAGGTDQLQLGFGGADPSPPGLVAPADLPEVIGGVITHPPGEDGFPAPPLPPALPPAATPPPDPSEIPLPPLVPPAPPILIGGGDSVDGGPGATAGPGVSAVPLPLAAYAGLSLLLLPVGRGMLRRVMSKSTEL